MKKIALIFILISSILFPESFEFSFGGGVGGSTEFSYT